MSSSPRQRRLLRFCLVGGVFALSLEVATAVLRLAPAAGGMSWAVIVLLVGVAALAGAGVLTHEVVHWKRQVERLSQLIPKVLTREAPIDELAKVAGGCKPLVPPLLEVFHDLRSQQVRLKQLEHEVRQMVARRTDALERQIGSLQQQAARDGLTGLLNRRALDAELPRLIEQAMATAQPLSLLMIDLDHFKMLNDTLGHQAGDAFLRSVGQLVRSAVPQAVGFRYGGDELALVLPKVEAAEARQIAERLSHTVAALARTLQVSPRPGASIGVAAISRSASNAVELLRQADADLYRVKSARRTARAA